MNLNIYNYLVNGYFQILSAFPAPLAWVVSLVVLVGFVYLFVGLLKSNLLFIIVVVMFLPVFIPILSRLFSDLWLFFVFLLHQVGLKF